MWPRSRLARGTPSLLRLLRVALLAPGAGAADCTQFKEDAHADAAPAASAANPVACDPGTPFGPSTLVAGLTDIQARQVSGLRLSPDYRIGYFHATGRPDSVGYGDLYTATRPSPSAAFEHVVPIGGNAIDTPFEEFDPTVTGDGLTIAFGRSAPSYPVHIFGATRVETSVPFGMAALLTDVNDVAATFDTNPFLREDGAILYFASSRVPTNNTDIYRAMVDVLAAPEPVAELNTMFSELAPVVTPDDLTVFFGSDRGDGNALGSWDIWMATRASGVDPFSAPRNVSELNSAQLDLPTFVTRDGCTVYFSSTRSGALLQYVATKRSP